VRTYKYIPDACADLPELPTVHLPAGLPLLFTDDGSPHRLLNDWIASLPQHNVRSLRSWDTYARSVRQFAEFLDKRQVDLLDDPATVRQALGDYADHRLQGDLKVRLDRQSFRLHVEHLEKFYTWAVEEGLLAKVPFWYVPVRGHPTAPFLAGGGRNVLKPAGKSARATIRTLSDDFLDLFIRAAGGLDPEGRPDPAFRGRNPLRNQTAVRFAVSTGLRRQELHHLLVWELPKVPSIPGSEFVSFPVPGRVAKGGKARETWIEVDVLTQVHDYIRVERARHARGAARRGWLPAAPLHIESVDATGCWIEGRRVPFNHLTIKERCRLVGPDGASPLLFLSPSGTAFAEDNWREIFDRIVADSRRFRPEFPEVTPHQLRHTFAVRTLRRLQRMQLSRTRPLAEILGEDPVLIEALSGHNALLVLRDFLGHAHLTTTQIYLQLQDPTRILSEEELALLREEEDSSS
jgi:site-specific recombinase XerD